MALTLETLRAIASCNPFRWDCVPWNEKNERIEAAGLLPYLTHGHNPHHQTFVTKAVIDRIAQEDPDSAQALRNRIQRHFIDSTLYYCEATAEPAVFEWIDQMVAERTREALTAIAEQRSSDEVVRRAI